MFRHKILDRLSCLHQGWSEVSPAFFPSKALTAGVAAIIAASFSFTATAQSKPDWVRMLPYGELVCSTTLSTGIEWTSTTQSFEKVHWKPRSFTVQRIDISDPGYIKSGCTDDKKPWIPSSAKDHMEVACYRYNNIPNLLGWAQGWCNEKYSRNGSVDVSCERYENFQPKIGFRPGGYFHSYGTIEDSTQGEPFINASFSETGRCSWISPNTYKNKFKIGSSDAYYPKGK